MFKNILIIGFGMIGSSIARTILKNNKSVKIYALDKSSSIERRLKKAKLSSVICLKSFDQVDKIQIDL
ncbi:MAG: prephenate dehydrogenase/arogenate dehydrogenase family protein, partial [Alphaproteobacteria bacterium]|nr:prephenate dehydrogenase/arogenate dehydrogenase family protein [Alphaproteobacteria bacterium]